MSTHEIVHYNLKYYGDIAGTKILGLILWFGLYGCFNYWKEFYITYYKHKIDPSAGYYESLRTMKSGMINMILFTVLMIIALLLLSNNPSVGDKIVFPGWCIFMCMYFSYLIYIYAIQKKDFDYFDDFKIIAKYALRPYGNNRVKEE